MNYSNIAYAKLNLTYDHEKFAQEYDQCILPNTRPIYNNLSGLNLTASLNSVWNMVPDELYTNLVASEFTENNELKALTDGRLPSWQMEQLMYVESDKMNGSMGGTTLRNLEYNKFWKIKPEYKNLEIVKYILKLPFKRIVFMHCVSLEAGQFASIHRDNKGLSNGKQTNKDNELYRNGYVVITLNISDGGVPLYWALDGGARTSPYKANDSVYMTSDYFLHGVPVTTSRRRQIRVTGIPTDALANLIDSENIVTIADDYMYQNDVVSLEI